MTDKILHEKSQLTLIIERIVVDDNEKKELIRKIETHPSSIPLKAILEGLSNIQTRSLNQEEIEIIDDLKFIYI